MALFILKKNKGIQVTVALQTKEIHIYEAVIKLSWLIFFLQTNQSIIKIVSDWFISR